nr:programmed cell death protein 2 [Onthophagus taurus]
MSSRVDLGFAEKSQLKELQSHFFPSKIGGKPAWLSLENVPNLECKSCNQPTSFLCQVYAPFEEDEKNFHRTVFIFVCMNCSLNTPDTIKVFRSNIPRKNDFYSDEPPNENDDTDFSVSKWVKLCELCGGKANKCCSKCKKVMYCCKEHQVMDWKENHKELCGKGEMVEKKKSRHLFDEYKIVIEEEEIDLKPEIDENKEVEKLKELELQGLSLQDISEEEIEAHSSLITDKTFQKFQKHIKNYPDQILRYERGGEPLWIAEEPIPESIPNCDNCGEPRQFEFQIMPQILNLLSKDCVLDWGILAVYTCVKSCDIGNKYVCEFIFKQDVCK